MKTIPRTWVRFAVLAVSCLSTAPQVLAQKVSYDYRPQSSFTRLRTFAFKQSAPPETVTPRTTTYDSPLVQERTEAAVAAALERRGLRPSDGTPDVYVTARWTFRPEYSAYWSGWDPWWGWSSAVGPGFGWPGGYGWSGGYGWYGWPGGGSWYVQEWVAGRLTIDLEDAASGQLIWRGVASKRVHESSTPARRTAKVNEQVADIFKKFPATWVSRD